MPNNIKEINIYPQIFLYKTNYVDAILADPSAETHETDVGQFFSIIDGVFKTMDMNPNNIATNSVPKISIATTINPDVNDIEAIIKYNTIVQYVIDNLTELRAASVYNYDSSDSIYYKVVDGIQFGESAAKYLCPFNAGATNIPIRIRYIYEIVTEVDADEYSYWFPAGRIGRYYETVIFAYGMYNFTPDTATDRLYPGIRLDVYDAHGELEDGDVSGQITLDNIVSDFPKYIVARLSVLGHSIESVKQYESGFSLGDFPLVKTEEVSGTLSEILAKDWVLYANMEKYDASNPSKTAIQYKAMSCYRKYIAFKVNNAFGVEQDLMLKYTDDGVPVNIEAITINCDMTAANAKENASIISWNSSSNMTLKGTLTNASANALDTVDIDIEATELRVSYGNNYTENVTLDSPIVIASTSQYTSVAARTNRLFSLSIGNMYDILDIINGELETKLADVKAISIKARLKTVSGNASPTIDITTYSEPFMILSGLNQSNGLISVSQIQAIMYMQQWIRTMIIINITGDPDISGKTVKSRFPLKVENISFTNSDSNITYALNTSTNLPESSSIMSIGNTIYSDFVRIITSEIYSYPVPTILQTHAGLGTYELKLKDSCGIVSIFTKSGTVTVPNIFSISKEPDGSELDGEIEATVTTGK